MILDESHERVYSPEAGVEQVVLGLYIIRGDNMCARALPALHRGRQIAQSPAVYLTRPTLAPRAAA